MNKIHFFFLLTLLFLPLCQINAQNSSMTDEQVAQFVMKENEKGTSQQQIVTQLIQKGVTIDQIRRVREKNEKQAKGDIMGAKNITGQHTTADRSRKKENNTTNQRKKFQNGTENNESEKTRKKKQTNKELEYMDELDYLLPDSLQDFEKLERKKHAKEVFGRNIFNKENLSFEPNMNIATPTNYRLGPGDAVYIDVWGASQKSIQVTVSPEGIIDIEGYGPISVSGLTVAEANSRLKRTYGARYANSNIKLTVGQTKTIMVNVMGEVEAPGTYTLSAFASVFHALYMAGGVNDIGTLRDIKVFRNNRLVTHVDVYDYILNGKLTGNVRLTDNDVIVVGPYNCLVNVAGKVKRPMYYEMKATESIGTLLNYAGGFTGDAYQKNLRLTRKTGGEYSVFTIDEFERGKFKVADGDSLTVDSFIPRYSNMVEVKGSVFRPGMYQVGGSVMTVRALIEASGGLTEDAFTARAVMHRRKADRTLEVLPLDIAGVMNNTISDIPLRNEDVLFIPSKKDAQEEKMFSIYGEIIYPGIYDFADNTTLEDLVLQAGGLKDAASMVKVDVSRRMRNNKSKQSAREIAKVYSFSLKDGFVIDGTPGFILEPFDEVFVRRSPGYVDQKHVMIEGEVAFSGTYALAKKTQRLSDLVVEAGGLTAFAYASGARLERKLTYAEKLRQQSLMKLLNNDDSISTKKLDLGETRYIGINLDKALAHPGDDQWDLVLEEGDRLLIPEYSNTVSINGDVMFPTTVSFRKGAKIKDYINQAGGYGQRAKTNRVFVINMNGTVSRAKNISDLTPGCEIVVPSKSKRKGMSLGEIMTIGTSTASLASIVAMLLTK
ncbi:MAG: SLBB domain-containing protein [Bacteroidaceae bacterium]